MNGDDWIIVPNWDRFQHYKDRRPPWIKLYVEILDNPEITSLPLATFGLLVKIWTAYATRNGCLSVKDASKMCSGRDKDAHIKVLNDAGLLTLSASKPLALSRALAREETEKRRTRARATPKPQPEPRPAAAAYEPFNPRHEPSLDRDAALELARLLAQP